MAEGQKGHLKMSAWVARFYMYASTPEAHTCLPSRLKGGERREGRKSGSRSA